MKRTEQAMYKVLSGRGALLSLALSSFLPLGESPHADPGPRPPHSPMFGGTGPWGQKLGLRAKDGLSGRVRW